MNDLKEFSLPMPCGPVVRRGKDRLCLGCGFRYNAGHELDPDEIISHNWFAKKDLENFR